MDATPIGPAPTRIAIQTPDGQVREVALTPEQARSAAWRAVRIGFWLVASSFGIGWAIGRWTAED
ncbi:MAG: hypothetical protein Q8R92_17915 [Deltaproteobacteria bacterium]|nr:hypothetical protein [Deltaproteobacteria bacterium]